MKRYMFFILLILLAMIACNTSNFDLDKVSFPINIATLQEKYDIKVLDEFLNKQYSTTEQDLMIFAGQSFYGLSVPRFSMMDNKLYFYEEDSTKRVDAFSFSVNKTEQTKKLDALLTKKLGKADFDYQKEKFTSRIWESEDKLYFFNINNTTIYNGKNVISSSLYVVNAENDFLVNFFSCADFQYYGNYLEAKRKPENQNKTFTYRDFVDQKDEDSYFLKNYVK